MKIPRFNRGIQGSTDSNTDSKSIQTEEHFQDGVTQNVTPLRRMKPIGIGLGVVLALGIGSPLAAAYYRYGSHGLVDIPLKEAVEEQDWDGGGINFQSLETGRYDVSFDLTGRDSNVQLVLSDIDLNLLIPQVPASAQGNKDLTRWFLTEREFNRQRVIFEPGSPHIKLSEKLAGYEAEDISISLTNNCLGAGYWELAVFSQPEDGDSEKLYQGYFTFPRGEYAELVAQVNPVAYRQVARTMEAWPGFRFLSNTSFALDELRTVEAETQIPVADLRTEQVFSVDEQVKKGELIVYTNDAGADGIQTWEDLRKADLQFQSFVSPGIYDEEVLWNSDFEQIANVTEAIGRRVSSPMSDKELIEVEIGFEGEAGEVRRLLVSGIELDKAPQLDTSEYSDGIYMPLGYGTPFTQEYSELVANPPAEYSFFSAVLDQDNRVVDYRRDIGLNGMVMHRDIDDPNKLHLYIMSYERITLVGHYVLELDRILS